MTLLARTVVRYHGDFDWPGIVIARRIFDRGARPWQFGCRDYIDAVDRLPADNRLGLSGRAQTTLWDEGLSAAVTAADVAVHEELTVDMLLSDLRKRRLPVRCGRQREKRVSSPPPLSIYSAPGGLRQDPGSAA